MMVAINIKSNSSNHENMFTQILPENTTPNVRKIRHMFLQ